MVSLDTKLNIEAYLKRIDYRGRLSPTAETLRALQVAHLRSVPFENLSIHTNQPIVLDDNALFEKIVTRRRGGFCYELNGLFASLLRALGFNVTMLSAGVASADGGWGPDFDHMALLVALEERWLADVGFGDSFLQPLRLDERGEQPQGNRSFRIDGKNDHLILLRREQDNEWEPQFRFTLEPHNYVDYADMCHYHQTSADSHFTRKRVCTLATRDGRITLSDLRLITTAGGKRIEETLANETEYAAVLKERFGIEIEK